MVRDYTEVIRELSAGPLTDVCALYGYTEAVDLNSPNNQALFKRMNACLQEELSELVDAHISGGSKESVIDEMADILGFIRCLQILSGNLNTHQGESLDNVWGFYEAVTLATTHMNMACNLLKNRPWKKSQYLVDKAEFDKRFYRSLGNYYLIPILLNISPEQLYVGVIKKVNTNSKRLKQGY